MSEPPSRLRRSLGLPGAIVVGLGAMLGTGVFAVWTPALAWAGGWLVLALLLAAAVAALNAVSVSRLARVHPESGGAYAYGRLRLGRAAGVAAGLAFIVGKSASSAAAALTIGVYLWPGQERAVAWVAIAIALAIDLRGIVRSVRVTAVLTATVLVIVLVTVLWGGWSLPGGEAGDGWEPSSSPLAVLAAAGLLFVAFAGYARITVIGEEVRDPKRTIPRAVAWSFVIVLAVYVLVAFVVLQAAQAGVVLGPAALEDIAQVTGSEVLRGVVVLGAVLGAGSVLISLLTGMGRTVFAMAAQGDAPRPLALVSGRHVPHRAAITVAVAAAVLVVPGRLSWALALSGASILIYYAVAHAASFTLPGPWLLRRAVPVLGVLLSAAIVLGLVSVR
jgi:basic amino acid/polyamine antiporter, APA family